MAEVLITLGIIGIVAALTFPLLLGKYQKVVTVNQLKKAYTVLSQMVLLSQEHNGAASFDTNATVDSKVVEIFFNSYWLPYFNNPTVSKNLSDPYPSHNPFCYLNKTIVDLGVLTQYSAGRIYFTTNDGTAYLVNMMDWKFEYDDGGNRISQTAMYGVQQNVWVDLNGINPPNILGKDVFRFVVFFDKNTVKPLGYNETTTEINNNCGKSQKRGDYCAAKIMNDGWQIKNDYPW